MEVIRPMFIMADLAQLPDNGNRYERIWHWGKPWSAISEGGPVTQDYGI